MRAERSFEMRSRSWGSSRRDTSTRPSLRNFPLLLPSTETFLPLTLPLLLHPTFRKLPHPLFDLPHERKRSSLPLLDANANSPLPASLHPNPLSPSPLPNHPPPSRCLSSLVRTRPQARSDSDLSSTSTRTRGTAVRRRWTAREEERRREKERRRVGSLIGRRCSRTVLEQGLEVMGVKELLRGRGRRVLDQVEGGGEASSRRKEEEARRRFRRSRVVLVLGEDGYDV